MTITKDTLLTCKKTSHSFLPLTGSHLLQLVYPACTHPSTLLSAVVYSAQGGLGCVPRRAVLLQSYLLTIIDSEESGEKRKRGESVWGGKWSDRRYKFRPAWTAAGFPREPSVHPAQEMLFWAARIIKASSDSPLSFFHYLPTFCVARQSHSITAFDFKCSLLTGMKNAYLAVPRRNSCVEREGVREREIDTECVCSISSMSESERDGETMVLKTLFLQCRNTAQCLVTIEFVGLWIARQHSVCPLHRALCENEQWLTSTE